MIRPVAVAVLLALLSPLAAVAGEKTVILNVDNATCALCAPIVKTALSRVSGVTAVQVKEADAMSGAVATVSFDDAVTGVPTLIAATTNAGYPSHVAQ
ncbi:cation transporter [Agrobacterium genomosp. 3]|jgi:mercuric ion binding protein|uniref:Mercuric transport protein periplasmic component n=5 Tax=Hyphomicrobiales TaxID=356 RepID=L0NNK0_9HYPH|nr:MULTISPECIES: cation transporter [Hyphomicrobiales]MBU1313864.1 cation transporter [Alphaproteobacteria bacterium]MCA1868531.1 cation transporter [Agrobacterium tomkonis]OJU48944.1 MAG: mercury transporter [Mesorhizobium sp. 61-13]CAD6438374.1 mercury transporter [Rhizobium sp. Q54]CAD6631083.1 mercury transporter [arsenite-oxidising bacterium NT-25]CUX65063.1 Mercuric transport protein periplasmic component [Agrobacterium genomosp. 5 str. CFBP 6626]